MLFSYLYKVAFFGDCPKFKESSPDTINLDRAVQYLWLKEHVRTLLMRMLTGEKPSSLACAGSAKLIVLAFGMAPQRQES